MVKEHEYYKILEVSPNASIQEIKKAYRKKAIHCHPDKGGDAEEFKKITEAYEVLSDSQKRKTYDMFGKDGKPQIDPTDIFQSMFGRSRGNTRKKVQKAPDIKHHIKITLEDIYHGKKIKLQVRRYNICSSCRGKGSDSGKTYSCDTCNGSGVRNIIRQLGPGMIQQMQTTCNICNGKGESIHSKDICKTCNGTKKEQELHTYPFVLPKGITNDIQLQINDEGNEYIEDDEKERSSIMLSVETLEHSEYKRDKNNLCKQENITLYEALFGFTRTFTHINKTLYTYFYKKYTKHTDTMCIKNLGMPVFNAENTFGDLLLTFHITYPLLQTIQPYKEDIESIFHAGKRENTSNPKATQCTLQKIVEKNTHTSHNSNTTNSYQEHFTNNQEPNCRTQ